MGKIVSNFFISLDGVVEAPETWHMSYFNDEMGEIVGAGMATNKAFLMGRKLYDEWSAYWPTSEDGDFVDFFNSHPKYVVSSTLQDPTWNNTTVVPGDVAAIQQLKDSIDGDLVLSGSATTVRWLLANGLLDELHLLQHPVVVGAGQRLFEGGDKHELKLADSRALSTGVTYLVYRPTQS
ncbi:dihydrofolate reductase family protein [Luteipulveratus halotolerans]|uniref:Pyrimidine reductase n=1 Tax=Luteipulveratus halotolerans TaxID=1631356 RepID=A0A0L6CF82_9MICO|nr:dihydrofolate reductase family protein [Luteipulveratus halotolerans]KNX36250.1 pyrimidine reductase [Luteipulveratus halotolerans]